MDRNTIAPENEGGLGYTARRCRKIKSIATNLPAEETIQDIGAVINKMVIKHSD